MKTKLLSLLLLTLALPLLAAEPPLIRNPLSTNGAVSVPLNLEVPRWNGTAWDFVLMSAGSGAPTTNLVVSLSSTNGYFIYTETADGNTNAFFVMTNAAGNGGNLTNLPFAATTNLVRSLSSTNGYFQYTVTADGNTNAFFVLTNAPGATVFDFGSNQFSGKLNLGQVYPQPPLQTNITHNEVLDWYLAVTNGQDNVSLNAANDTTNTFGGLLTILGTRVQSGNGAANEADSFAAGYGIASGDYSFAAGSSEASGPYSFAAGSSEASGPYSFAAGDGCTASGDSSFAAGNGCTASGVNAFADGNNANATHDYSYVWSSGAIQGSDSNGTYTVNASAIRLWGGPIYGNALGLTNGSPNLATNAPTATDGQALVKRGGNLSLETIPPQTNITTGQVLDFHQAVASQNSLSNYLRIDNALLTINASVLMNPASINGIPRTLSFGRSFGAPSILFYDTLSHQTGIAPNTAGLEYFIDSANAYQWNKGGAYQAPGVNELMRLDAPTAKLSVAGSFSGSGLGITNMPAASMTGTVTNPITSGGAISGVSLAGDGSAITALAVGNITGFQPAVAAVVLANAGTNLLATPTIGTNLTATFVTNAGGTVTMTMNGITMSQLNTLLGNATSYAVTNLVAVADARAPRAGELGESIETLRPASIMITLFNGLSTNVCSVTLSAGTWAVSGSANIVGNGTSTGFTTSITSNSKEVLSDGSQVYFGSPTVNGACATVSQKVFYLSGSTPIYLTTQISYSAGTYYAYGKIIAIRIR